MTTTWLCWWWRWRRSARRSGKRGAGGDDDGLPPDGARAGRDFDHLAAGPNAPHWRPLEERRPTAGGRRRKAEAGAKWIEGEAARSDGAAAIESGLARQRGRGQPGVIEARRAPGIVLAPQASHRIPVSRRHVQQVLRHEVAADVRALDGRGKIQGGSPHPLPQGPCRAKTVRAGRVLERRVEVLANQPGRRRRARGADAVGLEDDDLDAGRGEARGARAPVRPPPTMMTSVSSTPRRRGWAGRRVLGKRSSQRGA